MSALNVCPECGMSLVYSTHLESCTLGETHAHVPEFDPAAEMLAEAVGEVIVSRSKAATTSVLVNAGYRPGSAEWNLLENAINVGVSLGARIMIHVYEEQGFVDNEAITKALGFYEDEK